MEEEENGKLSFIVCEASAMHSNASESVLEVCYTAVCL